MAHTAETKPADIAELKRLRPIIQAFADTINQNWRDMDDEATHDRYHELYDMVPKASGDVNFQKYVQPISYWAVFPPGAGLLKEHAVAIMNSAVQLFAYLDQILSWTLSNW